MFVATVNFFPQLSHSLLIFSFLLASVFPFPFLSLWAIPTCMVRFLLVLKFFQHSSHVVPLMTASMILSRDLPSNNVSIIGLNISWANTVTNFLSIFFTFLSNTRMRWSSMPLPSRPGRVSTPAPWTLRTTTTSPGPGRLQDRGQNAQG